MIKPPSNPNQVLLDEVNGAGLWFRAWKTRPIWAKKLDRAERVETLEGMEDVPAGQCLCRGEAGDVWPQAPERLTAKYEPVGEIDSEGWQKHIPRPDNQGVLAAQISHEFTVHAEWGELRGKPGDYLVKDYEDRETEYPDDIWIVDRSLFVATYDWTTEGKGI